MTKKWTYEEFNNAMNAARSAFSNTLLTHGMTRTELTEFHDTLDGKDGYKAVDDAFGEVITWEEE